LQLKCAHIVPAKVPLPEKAIFNRNKAAAERWRAAHKAQHKEREIAKRDWNNKSIKRQKSGERGVSSNEDPSPEPSWSGDVASVAVDWSDMLGRPHRRLHALRKCHHHGDRRRPRATRM
jgi:hypothetical protein